MQPPKSVTRVETYAFEKASEDEMRQFAPGLVERTTRAAASMVNSALLWKLGGDLYKFFGPAPKSPLPWTLVETTVRWNWVLFSNPVMLKGISLKFRHSVDGDFANDMIAKVFLEIGSELFGVQLQPDDTITTCAKERSKVYRSIAARHLGSALLQPRMGEIDQLCNELLKEFEEGEVDVTRLSQKLVARIVNRFLLGLEDKDAVPVAEAIIAANAYILAKGTNSATPGQFDPHAEVLRNAIDKALSNNTPFIQELHKSDLSETQKRMMIAVVFFTSLGGTISQMTGLLWHLSKHPQYQLELCGEIVQTSDKKDPKYPFSAALLAESFRVHPSTMTLDRPTQGTHLLTHTSQELVDGKCIKEVKQHLLVPPKYIITLYQPWAAQKCQNPDVFDPHRKDQVELYPFGHGVHKCVGQYLSEELIGRFARAFTKRFSYSSPLEKLPLQGYFNLEPENNVLLQVKRRP